jgi:DMSO/TMAO reductase YedYZ molybdopterin-dependent catalytic subunit
MQLSEIRFIIRWVHVLAGIGFSLVFLTNIPYCWRCRQGATSGPNHWSFLWVLFVACTIWTVTGLGLTAMPYLAWSGPAANWFQQVHIWVAAAGIWLVLPHLLHAARRRPKPAIPVKQTAEQRPGGQDRRGFLRYIMGGIFIAGFFGAWRWLNQQAATVKSESLAVFAQCNRMNPAPQPLPESLPPKGGGYTGKFKVYKIEKEIPCADSANWQFQISGLADKPQIFHWEDFLKLPRTVQVSDFHCVEGWSVYKITYEGVRLAELLDRVGVKPEAKFVKFFSAEKVYTEALSMEQARMGDVMAAVLLDGSPIPSDLGGPVRLVVPQMFAYKAVKWLVGMELTATPHRGYWEERGYPVDAWIKAQPTQ